MGRLFLTCLPRAPPPAPTDRLLLIDAGPNTVVGLSKQAEGVSLDASKAVAALLPAYTQLLETLKGLGVPEVQVILHYTPCLSHCSFKFR